MSIDFSKLNIPIEQFQSISSGEYNAGEVRIASETTLGKVNNHVIWTIGNGKSLSHAEVLAVKDAFVKALAANGLTAADLAPIRRRLGLAADGAVDKTLHERSLLPLTRQAVREILDSNADKINMYNQYRNNAFRVRKEKQIAADNRLDAAAFRAHRATRDSVNATLPGAGGTKEHEGVAWAHAVVAGDVDFRSADDVKYLLAQAKAQLQQILLMTQGAPDATREAMVEFDIKPDGFDIEKPRQHVRIQTGMSAEKYVRKLEDIICRLSGQTAADGRSIEAREAFAACGTAAARRAWLAAAAAGPDGAFKVRTAAVLMLTEAGIDDWETLSLVNRVPDAQALEFAKSLAGLEGKVRGSMLRRHELMRSLADSAANGPAPAEGLAAIPATSPAQWNARVRSLIGQNEPEELPHDIRALFGSVAKDMRKTFGLDAVGADGFAFVRSAISERLQDLVPDGAGAARVTAETLRAEVSALALKKASGNYIEGFVRDALAAAGGDDLDEDLADLRAHWAARRPQLVQRLSAAKSAAEADAVFKEFGEEIESDAARIVSFERAFRKAETFYCDALASKLGVPVVCLHGKVDLGKLEHEVGELRRKIRSGEDCEGAAKDMDEAVRRLAGDLAGKWDGKLEFVDVKQPAQSEADIARRNECLAKYGGGLSPEDRKRLETYAGHLDFSEAGAAGSEKALARYLDGVCGGGGLDNPASSVSRRALAGGWREEDLPGLARAARLVKSLAGATGEKAAEEVIDRNSAFSVRWNAALQTCSQHLPGPLDAEVKTAVARAVLLCGEDAQLLDIVTGSIARVVCNSVGELRTPAAIRQTVENVRTSLGELRACAADDEKLLAAGLKLLKGLQARHVPAGYVKYLIDSARRAPIDALAKLNGRSSPVDIHAANLQFYRNGVSILAGRDHEGLLDGADESQCCLGFLDQVMIARLTASQRRNVRNALASLNGSKTVAVYRALGNDAIDLSGLKGGIRTRVQTIGTQLEHGINELNVVVGQSLDEAVAPRGIAPVDLEQDNYRAFGAPQIVRSVTGVARAEGEADQKAFLSRFVSGTSSCVETLRKLVADRLPADDSSDYREGMNVIFGKATEQLLNVEIVREAKKLATQPFAKSQFSADRRRQVHVYFPDGRPLSTDPVTAADEIACFVTGRADAVYEALGKKEKAKVHVLMAILTQTGNTLAVEKVGMALDPQSRRGQAFSFVFPNGTPVPRAFRLKKNAEGDITIRFEADAPVLGILMPGAADVTPLGAGSRYRASWKLDIPAQQLEDLSGKDFSVAPDAQGEALGDRVASVGPEFRLDFNITSDFTAVLNAGV